MKSNEKASQYRFLLFLIVFNSNMAPFLPAPASGQAPEAVMSWAGLGFQKTRNYKQLKTWRAALETSPQWG